MAPEHDASQDSTAPGAAGHDPAGILPDLDQKALPPPDAKHAGTPAASPRDAIVEALMELARDGVIPELRLRKPEDWADLLAARKTRAVITRSCVVFPRLLPAPPDSRAV